MLLDNSYTRAEREGGRGRVQNMTLLIRDHSVTYMRSFEDELHIRCLRDQGYSPGSYRLQRQAATK
jgi:hypothetical protein